jgi:hypothetical protein
MTRSMLARGLEGVARLLLPTEPQRGLCLIAAADAVRQTLGLPNASDDRVGLERWQPATHAAINYAAARVPLDVPATAVALADALDACATAASATGGGVEVD